MSAVSGSPSPRPGLSRQASGPASTPHIEGQIAVRSACLDLDLARGTRLTVRVPDNVGDSLTHTQRDGSDRVDVGALLGGIVAREPPRYARRLKRRREPPVLNRHPNFVPATIAPQR